MRSHDTTLRLYDFTTLLPRTALLTPCMKNEAVSPGGSNMQASQAAPCDVQLAERAPAHAHTQPSSTQSTAQVQLAEQSSSG